MNANFTPLRDNFCVLILSHGRAGNVVTIKTLESRGYTGPWYIVVDNTDKQVEDYKALYGSDKVVVFDKQEMLAKTDTVDNFSELKTITYARNVSFSIAKKLGYRYFVQLDDDYTSFEWRFLKEHGTKLGVQYLKHADYVFEAVLKFLDSSKDIATVALAQVGDFIGGAGNKAVRMKKPLRKAMNSFFCDTEKKFQYIGTFNEDVNTYTRLSMLGKMFFSVIDAAVVQGGTQQNAGGITESYKKYGTYVKSFYTVIVNPSAARVKTMMCLHPRIHHIVKWNNCVPKLISERWKKK